MIQNPFDVIHLPVSQTMTSFMKVIHV